MILKKMRKFEISKETLKLINAGSMTCVRSKPGSASVPVEMDEDLTASWQSAWQSLGWSTTCYTSGSPFHQTT
ncbi:hypothetical protein GCM10011344_43820 [Dokdonia pacifica]|uniref:Uncharacterized protein n=1 Tax=Dokdonia pacifica TaxID=1627892 RepID=A0A239CHB5_9FLAO|nr:hypothetical protein [Dokdonia pacifica]GGG38221.1 hypothetical protein GCM10011344_43820 [Dokdonia pacifica]SNS19636.1 hypothetical protein SAMN06265376_1087 [Dokdonia pacifica]